VKTSRADAAWIGVCAIVMVALQAYIAGAVESWTVAGAFGQRRFVGLTPLLVLGLAALMAATRGAIRSRRLSGLRPRRAEARRLPVVILAGAITLGVWGNLGLMMQFGQHTMDRQQLTLRENARVTFLVLPREAPSIVWQYLTRRESFYGQPRQ
jgi:hypothetical protein